MCSIEPFFGDKCPDNDTFHDSQYIVRSVGSTLGNSPCQSGLLINCYCIGPILDPVDINENKFLWRLHIDDRKGIFVYYFNNIHGALGAAFMTTLGIGKSTKCID